MSGGASAGSWWTPSGPNLPGRMSENGDSRRNRLARALKRLDGDPRLLALVRLGRSRLPGDDRYGDPLSLTGDQAPAVLGRRLSALTSERPGALRGGGMSAPQVGPGGAG